MSVGEEQYFDEFRRGITDRKMMIRVRSAAEQSEDVEGENGKNNVRVKTFADTGAKITRLRFPCTFLEGFGLLAVDGRVKKDAASTVS